MIIVILVVILMALVSVALIVFISYKHHQRKKSKKEKYQKQEGKIEKENFEEVSLKALEKPKESLGKLVYSITYDEETSTMKIYLKSAHDLLAMDMGGTSDPYVKVWLKDYPKVKKQTRVKKRTLNPTFNEEVVLDVDPTCDIKSQVLIMTVFDFDRFSKHDIIGCLTIHLSELDLSTTIDDWAELEPPSSDNDKETPLGDICLSLKHLPTEENLVVTIIEAKNLKKHVDEEYYDPFVKIVLTENGKKLKKKLTTVKKNTPHPYFNEEFTIPLSHEIVNKALLTVIVYNCYQGNQKKQLPIGNVILGASITGNGMKHWKEMLANPKRAIAHWHGLVQLIDQ